ncbi:GpE family phage tail protein [Aliiroseovarius lamellibrachiae]|nr:GpE family phage tail protein [Aliiroseovarius lamellibrachiae]MBT2131234.1 GpE family phage tail protein [Aliiroseovarius lamellibrachiae]
MADIAMVFGWGPDQMDNMSIEDLAMWREKARERYEAQMKANTPQI